MQLTKLKTEVTSYCRAAAFLANVSRTCHVLERRVPTVVQRATR